MLQSSRIHGLTHSLSTPASVPSRTCPMLGQLVDGHGVHQASGRGVCRMQANGLDKIRTRDTRYYNHPSVRRSRDTPVQSMSMRQSRRKSPRPISQSPSTLLCHQVQTRPRKNDRRNPKSWVTALRRTWALCQSGRLQAMATTYASQYRPRFNNVSR